MKRDWVDGLSIENRIAVVTGAASGIGRETALALADAGADLVIADINEAGLDETRAMVEELGRRAVAQRADVGKRADLDALARAAVDSFGRIDVWVNVAGVVTHTPILDVTEDEMDRQIAINQKGVYWGCVAAARIMKDHGGGSIVNVSSSGGDVPPPGTSVYAITKAAVNMTTRACALEFAPLGIRVNTVSPGYVYTPMTRAAQEPDPVKREAWLTKMAEMNPLGRIGEPRDIAMAILYLCSDAAGFVTGQILRPNGGASMI